MGSLFKSKTKATKAPFESNPWKPQQEYLIKGFDAGAGALDNAIANNQGITDFTADLTGGQQNLAQQMSAFGTGTVGNVSSAAINAGLGASGAFGSSIDNAQNIYGRVSQDPTQRILANGAAYANDPYLQGQIDAALGDVRTAFDRNVGDINSAATGSGNINSTRSGTLEAYALDDAMDRAANISSTMRGQAYQSGLDRAMASDQFQTGAMMDANAALSGAGLAGFDLAQGGAALGMSGLNDAFNAESIFQNQAQAEIDGQRQYSREELDLISQYMAAIGGNYGSNGFQTQVTQSQSPFQTLVGAAATYAGAGGTFCWVAREVYGEHSPKWRQFRAWMFTQSPEWFFRLYARHGEKAAGVVKRNPWLKRFIRPLMNRVIK